VWDVGLVELLMRTFPVGRCSQRPGVGPGVWGEECGTLEELRSSPGAEAEEVEGVRLGTCWAEPGNRQAMFSPGLLRSALLRSTCSDFL
jgi:hypothetical protein